MKQLLVIVSLLMSLTAKSQVTDTTDKYVYKDINVDSVSILIPNGTYKGLWSGYSLEMFRNGKIDTFHINVGVRGMDVPCVVEVNNGRLHFLNVKW